MKKLIVFLLAAALLCSALTGCKGNGNNGNHDSGAAAGDSNNGGSGDNGGNNGGSGDSGNGSNSGNTGSAGYDGPKVDLLVDDLSAYIELDPASYKEGFKGANSGNWNDDIAMISGATMTSDAMRVAVKDIFAALESVKGGAQ